MPSVAHTLIEGLRREGITHIFGIPGTQNLPLLDVLRGTPDIRFILTRHEQGAAFMAYGYARAGQRPAVVTATEGPGVTNMATPFGAAYRGNVPIIGINGLQEAWLREKDASQEMDQISFFKPITKWAYSISGPEKAQEALRKAFRVALSEPPGPVHLEAPSDIYLEEVEQENWQPAQYRTTTLPSVDAGVLDEIVARLERAERPVILAGSGVLRERACEALIAFAERHGIPVAPLQFSPDAFPTAQPLALGPLGRNGWESANRAVKRADLVLAVGARMDLFSTTFKHGLIQADATLIHHAASDDPIGTVFPVDVAAVGSTPSLLGGLTQRLGERRWAWLDVGAEVAQWEAQRQALIDADAEPIQPPFVADVLRRTLPKGGIMVVDAGNAGKHARMHFVSHAPDTYMFIDNWAAVGAGFPTAIGAALARPDVPVLAVQGDMGFMCNIGELETAVREKIKLVAVVFNDQGLGNERAFQNAHYGGRHFAVDYRNPDFGELARVFGAHGETVTRPADLEAAMQRAFAAEGPAVVDVMIDQNHLAPVLFEA
ncbi:thiamine pyrophosphate-binding protein [Halomonas sp. HP20-15]|uniref:thiamine pyrophosphate-binding protein n=1 Tax=Halomonas sp. HP20-15 TaxID=3085901 RepID=UPI002981B014|nr:thiamine pyrophosphate-binding protein [Halomonas sp. HP20-15]MDW5377389.1 thiamine pyrophosphate-binding protein [Halomonas sp. HP20-15]